MINVFLSASVPYLSEDKDSWYFENADLTAIRDAILGIANVVLPNYCLIWGGHPSITKLVRYAYQAMEGIEDDKELHKLSQNHVRLYQSEFFLDEMPEENNAFGKLIITEKKETRAESLQVMRLRMLTDEKISLGLFVGGMDGVEKQEYHIFRKQCPKAPAIPFPTTGAAALRIYQTEKEYLRNTVGVEFYERLMKDYAYMDLTHDLIKLAEEK